MATGYQSEIRRVWGVGPKALDMAFYRIPRTMENLRFAEEELDKNTLAFTEDRIAEERKTLEWVRQEMEKESQAQENKGDKEEEGQAQGKQGGKEEEGQA